jgi:hypothetical protein
MGRPRSSRAVFVGVFCALFSGSVAHAASPPPPREALMQAGNGLRTLASHAHSSSIHGLAADAAKELARASVPTLWIDARNAVAPSYGSRVFAGSVAALTDLQRLVGLSVPRLSSTITRIVRADRDLADGAIKQAHGGNQQLLAAASRDLAAGDRKAAGGHPASAVGSYTKAWERAFDALAQLVAAEATGMPSSALAAAATEALGSKEIALAGPMIQPGRPPLTLGGKPELFFAGSEACPFCAVQRWGMIVALSQFGTFSNLRLMQSAPTEPPQIMTFTFFGSSYRSPYISFVPVEVLSNIPKGFGFEHLQRLTPAQNALLKTFDPPGQTPFIDVANRFTSFDSTVLPPLIRGMSWTEIASSLRHPTSISAQAIAGEAEVLTAELCLATKGAPASVCSTAIVKQYEAALPLLNGRGGGCPTMGAIAGPRREGDQPPRARATRCHT